MELSLPAIMFGYGSTIALAGAGWLLYGMGRGGIDLAAENRLLIVVAVMAYMVPIITPPQPPRGGWPPAAAVTRQRTVAARLMLVLATANHIFWPLYAMYHGPEALFGLVIPSQALLAGVYIASIWGLGARNVFPKPIVAWGEISLVSRVLRPIARLLPGRPSVSFEEWVTGLRGICEFAADEAAQRDAWLGIAERKLFATYDDLRAEIFVHLESELCLRAYGGRLGSKQARSVANFLDAFHRFHTELLDTPALEDVRTLLSSTAWTRVREAAGRVKLP